MHFLMVRRFPSLLAGLFFLAGAPSHAQNSPP